MNRDAIDRSGKPPGIHEVVPKIAPLAIGLGLTSIVAQYILLREFLGAFGGNELVVGTVLANWMVLTGLGALLGRKAGERGRAHVMMAGLLLVLAVLPPATVFALRMLRNVIFTAGSMIGIAEVLASSFALLVPFCLLSGFGFTLLTFGFGARRGGEAGAKAYAWESMGGAIGGIIFNIVLITFFDTFQVLALLFLLDTGLVLFVSQGRSARGIRVAGACLLMLGLWVMFLGDVERVSRSRLFPGQEIVESRDTPYGALTLTRQGDQTNLFENGVLFASSNDVTTREEGVHYAMLQRRSPRAVLMIGGAASGGGEEALKYGVGRIDEVEINPWIVDAGARHGLFPRDPRIHIITEDARSFVNRTDQQYDAVLVNLPDPSTAQLNRCYTLEFFQRIKKILTPHGVVSASLLPGAEYQGEAARLLGSVLLKTMHEVFPHVLIIPGERHYFLGSDDPLDIGIGRLVEKRAVNTEYVNSSYIDDDLLAQRSRDVMSSFANGNGLNTDFHPLCYSLQLEYWMSSFGFGPGWLSVPLALLAILVFWRSSPVGAGIFAMGLAASSMEIVLLVAFQVLCGSMYQMTGIVVTAFMAGLALGAGPVMHLWQPRGKKGFVIVEGVVGGVCLLVLPLLFSLHAVILPLPVLYSIFIAATLGVALLTGTGFALGLSARGGSLSQTASGLYGLDLLGSAAGALGTSVFVLPKFGITGAGLCAGLFCFAGTARCLLSGRRSIT